MQIGSCAQASHLLDESGSEHRLQSLGNAPMQPIAMIRYQHQRAQGEPLVFQIRENCLGFVGHPGAKSAMIEDLIMGFEEVPDRTAETLEALRETQAEIAAALGDIMVGLIQITGLMQPSG